MQRKPLKGTKRSPQQEAAEKNAEQRERSAHKKKERQQQLGWRSAIVIVLMTIVLIAFFIIYSWSSYEAAVAVGDMLAYIFGTGVAVDVIAWAIRLFMEIPKKKVLRVDLLFFLSSVLAVLLLGLVFLNTIAKGELAKKESVTTVNGSQTNDEEESGVIDGEADTIPDTDIGEAEEFDWNKDWFVINLSMYRRSCANVRTCMEELLTEFAHKYVYNSSTLGTRTAKELNEGDYGFYISLAKDYDRQYKLVTAIPLKITARQEELKKRELANGISFQYDNLKIMGDIHKELIELQGLDGADKVTELESALSCYIEALPLAYWNNAGRTYYSELWKELSWAFTELGKCGAYTDTAHEARGKLIAEITIEFAANPPMPDIK